MRQTSVLVRWRGAIAWVGTVGALALGGCASLERPPACVAGAGPEIACTAQGAARGEVAGSVIAFRGLPYAAPPVGERRWQPPAPPESWSGVREARQFGPVCPQLAGSEVVGSEDCLTVNVYRPAAVTSGPLPVLVFFPGGGNHAFSGQGAGVFGGVSYDGERVVAQGAVLVTFNYRLGALGFLAAHAGVGDGGEALRGNFGTRDQIALLHWVQRNVRAFGGDPRRVMLFGTSAGGGNLCALMAAPSARGLFHAVAMQSSVPTGCELPTLADAQASTGRRVADALGCTSGNRTACLRRQSTAEVVKAVPGSFGLFPRLYGPVVDGALIPQQPLQAIREKRHHAVPTIIGNTSLETMQFVGSVGPVPDAASYRTAVERVFGAASAERILTQYPVSAYATPRAAMVQLTTDGLFTCQSRRIARVLSQAQTAPVYRYFFEHALDNDAELKALGAVHTVEHAFFFPWRGSYRPTPTDLAVQRLLLTHWVQLAASGQAGSGPAGAWAPVTPGDRALHIGASPRLQPDDGAAHCDFWDTVQLLWPHL